MRAFCERLLALVFALSVLCVAASAARADAYEDAIAHFLADSFDDTIEGINAVAASGHPLAEKVLGALQGKKRSSSRTRRISCSTPRPACLRHRRHRISTRSAQTTEFETSSRLRLAT
jgi:hypothetical protein